MRVSGRLSSSITPRLIFSTAETAIMNRTVLRSAVRPLMLCLIALGGSLSAGETLYNGIKLPDQWPPKPEKFDREVPQTPPIWFSRRTSLPSTSAGSCSSMIF